MSLCFSVCFSVCLPTCFSVSPPIRLSFLSIHLSVSMSVRLSIHLSVNTTVRLFVCLSIRLHIHPSASQPFRLPNPNVNLLASLPFLLSASLMQALNSITDWPVEIPRHWRIFSWVSVDDNLVSMLYNFFPSSLTARSNKLEGVTLETLSSQGLRI